MTLALVTQLLNALEYHQSQTRPIHNTELAVEAAREYLATEPSGERADSAQWLREFADMEFSYYSREATQLRKAADMLEADAQPKQVTCQIYGHVVGACVECNTHIEAQQAKRVPMTAEEIEAACRWIEPSFDGPIAYDLLIARAIEAHHGITPEDDEPEDLYALALKADNLGQP